MNEEMKNRVQRGFKGGGANEWSWRGERNLGEGRRRKGKKSDYSYSMFSVFSP